MKMPFGQYKGLELDEIIEKFPEYIVWLGENCELRGELKTIVGNNYKKCLKAKEEQDVADAYYATERSWHDGDDQGF